MRAILHSDMNSYYASVEMMLDPKLRGKAIAVCGSTETRHGIVLAKSELAKRQGVKTGMANWEAQRCCPGLITVPPHYEQYIKYSKLAHEIYGRYTDLVEPFGMDECWLDVSGSSCMGDPLSIAEEIRQATKEELGLTVSIGVSFNKIFAKLGSDMKKPDAITCITPESYKTQVWPLNASELLGVGPATTRKLAMRRINTIGDLANCDPERLHAWLGVNGLKLWQYANGADASRVSPYDYTAPIKSVSHGITCSADLHTNEEGDTGHAQLKMVSDVYSHILDEDRRHNAEKMERDFYKKAENQSLVAPEAKPSNAATEQLVNLLNASPELAAQLLQMLTANQAGQAATA